MAWHGTLCKCKNLQNVEKQSNFVAWASGYLFCSPFTHSRLLYGTNVISTLPLLAALAHHMCLWRPAAMQNSIHGVTSVMRLISGTMRRGTNPTKLLRMQAAAAAAGCCIAPHSPAPLDKSDGFPWGPGQGKPNVQDALTAGFVSFNEQDTRRNNVWNLTSGPVWRGSELEDRRNPELGPTPGRAVPLGIYTICSHLLSLSCRFRNMLTACAVTSWGLLCAQRNARHPNCISNSWNESTPLATAWLKNVNKKYRGECIIQKQQASPSEIRIHLESS